MRITTALLRAVYNWLRLSTPFDALDLPPGSGVEFFTRMPKNEPDTTMGAFIGASTRVAKPRIWIAAKCHKTYQEVAMTVAHEMIHMALDARGDVTHGRRFCAIARVVCDYHGFSYRSF
jgi:hypothetical protein